MPNMKYNPVLKKDLDLTNANVAANTSSLAGKVKKGDLYVNVKDFGAKGDGVIDDTVAIQNAINSTTSGIIYFPAGIYCIGSEVVLHSDLTLVFSKGSSIKAITSTVNLFNLTGCSNVSFLGDSTIIDLNQNADRALFMGSSNTTVDLENIMIKGFVIKNKNTVATTNAQSIRVAKVKNVTIEDVSVSNYAKGNTFGGNECYGISIHYCDNTLINDVTLTDCYIGFLTQGVNRLTLKNFIITTPLDNGIYLLSNSNGVNVSDGIVDGAEEGIVISTDYTSVSRVTLKNCTNNAISLRKGSYINIEHCKFNSNVNDIINSSTYVNLTPNTRISNCDFIQTTGQVLAINSDGFLVSQSNIDSSVFNSALDCIRIASNNNVIKNCFLQSNVATGNPIKISADTEGNNNIIINCHFKNITVPVINFFLTGGQTGGVGNQVLNCTFTNCTSNYVQGNGATKINLILTDRMSSAPSSNYWIKGSMILNSAPASAGFIGWVCTTTGNACNTAWAATTAYNVGQQVFNSNKVYECTIAGTSSSTAPTHSTGTATDGTVTWKYVNTLAVFKTYGVIS